MLYPNKIASVAGLLALSLTGFMQVVQAAETEEHTRLKQAPMPHQRQSLPPTAEQKKFNLPPTNAPRLDLGIVNKQKNLMAPPPSADCKNMSTLAGYSGDALATYIVNLPSYECHYGLFSLNATEAAKVYSPANFTAVVNRFAQEASNYNATNMNLVNLIIYLRAGYYLAGGNTIPAPAASLLTSMRGPIKQLVDGNQLFKINTAGPSTAAETLKLVTNLHDEAYYLSSVKNIITRYTNTPSNPAASDALKSDTVADGFTAALTVLFYGHSRPDALSLLRNDLSYATTLNNFIVNNKAALLGTPREYQLSDTENEAFRFMQYPNQLSTVKPMVKYQLSHSTMTGADAMMWLNAASAVKYYDNANCAEYGTCNYETTLANTILKNNYTCSPSLKIRAQDMTTAQMQDSCAMLAAEETYFHTMVQSKRQPVAADNNSALEVVVFDDYTNYGKYASLLYGIDTNNGGMYLEGDPSVAGNQARFVAHEASWLRPAFHVWNLQHEYVHYLDGRYDMKGDFGDGTVKPTVWWIEGIAEYLSLKNNNQKAIDATRSGTAYKLSQIFGNTYSMPDYVARAYNWGYMATRFMMEKHRSDVDVVLAKFRAGDYDGYQAYMNNIGTRYDNEFASWLTTVTTAGEPPLPVDNSLPDCPAGSYLGKNCVKRGYASSTQTYAYIMVPAGAKNLKLTTSGGTGDVDMYVSVDKYPSTGIYDYASVKSGNDESVTISNPTANRWYYIVLSARQSFAGVNVSATYD